MLTKVFDGMSMIPKQFDAFQLKAGLADVVKKFDPTIKLSENGKNAAEDMQKLQLAVDKRVRELEALGPKGAADLAALTAELKGVKDKAIDDLVVWMEERLGSEEEVIKMVQGCPLQLRKTLRMELIVSELRKGCLP